MFKFNFTNSTNHWLVLKILYHFIIKSLSISKLYHQNKFMFFIKIISQENFIYLKINEFNQMFLKIQIHLFI